LAPDEWRAMTVSDRKEWWPGTELNRRRQPFQGWNKLYS
jgi:hypothetical protein